MTDNFEMLSKLNDWQPPADWIRVKTFDCHTCGEPLRIIINGFPKPEGNTIIARRKYLKENFDHLRTALMWEPRGHADQYGAVITPPVSENADFGALFLHNEGYSTMCGHAIIALTKVALETGMISRREPETEIRIDTPAGLIKSYAKVQNGRVLEISFQNVPSFILLENKTVKVKGVGEVKFDVAFGGAFYAFVNADNLGIEMSPENFRGLIEKGMAIKKAVMENFEILHPFEKELSFLYGTIFFGKPHANDADSRNVCIFAEGELDRSPTGTGLSARLALNYLQGKLKKGESLTIESILGTKFTGRVIEETKFGKYPAVIPEISGDAFITGRSDFFIDPDDNLKFGFMLR